MRRLASSILAATLAVAGFFGGALTAQQVKTSDPKTMQIREIGKELKCQCGCAYTVADCNMLYCHFRDPVNMDIEEMLDSGMGPGAILSALLDKYGKELSTEPPPVGFGAVGWVMPFVVLAMGLIAAPFIVQRWRKNQLATEAAAPAGQVDPDTMKRLEAEIERDLSQFD